MENQHFVSPSRQCSSTPVVLVKDFLANNLTALEIHLYSPDLSPADFYLFPRLKTAWKGWRFCGSTDIIKNATEELERFSRKGLQECFKYLYSRWEKRIVAQGGMLWRKYSLNDCSVLCISEIKWFREHFETTIYCPPPANVIAHIRLFSNRTGILCSFSCPVRNTNPHTVS